MLAQGVGVVHSPAYTQLTLGRLANCLAYTQLCVLNLVHSYTRVYEIKPETTAIPLEVLNLVLNLVQKYTHLYLGNHVCNRVPVFPYCCLATNKHW